MATPEMEALLGEDGAIAAPAVGFFRPAVRRGTFLEPGLPLGTLQVLGRFFTLRVPPGARGWVKRLVADDLVVPVAYRQPLLELTAADATAAGPPAPAAAGAAGAAAGGDGGDRDGERGEDRLAPVRSQTDGVFYRRPGPGEPPFVDVGSRVEPGTVLGLVEIMKCFNKIRYELERPGTIARIHSADGAEVKSGELLMEVALE